jgi:succinoglycan biosynthesis protein ExoL
MLALANRLRRRWAVDAPVVYECLDIHRLMLRRDFVGRGMRTVERAMARDASLLLTSSPAFVTEYFEPYGQFDKPVLLVENKVLFDGGARGRNPALAASETGGSLRIGWFGALRCRRSLSALAALTRRTAGGVEVVLRGTPARIEFEDFDGVVASEPHLRFEGPYRNPDNLATIYSEVHFAWAIDYFEAGRNSKWLLPNRIYEGCLHGAIPVALAGTETAALLARLHIGIILDDTEPDTLARVFGGMSGARVAALARDVANVDIAQFACDAPGCRALVARLEALRIVEEAAVMVPA